MVAATREPAAAPSRRSCPGTGCSVSSGSRRRAHGSRERSRVDLWHGPHYTAPLRVRIPTVVTVHDLTLLEHPEWHERPKALFFGRMIPAAVARAVVCVCVSRHTAERLAAVLPPVHGAREREVVVIPHGVDHARFHPVPDARADLAVLDALGVRPPYVAFLGTIEPRKDVSSLVRAFATVASSRPELRLVLAGGMGWDAGPVHSAIAASGVAHRIVRTGYVRDDVVAPLLRRAAVVVYPSLEEGFGLPALEALACGAPLVTTAGSSIEEFVGDAALLVPPGDVGALAAAIERAQWTRPSPRCSGRSGPDKRRRSPGKRPLSAHLDAYRRALALRAG